MAHLDGRLRHRATSDPHIDFHLFVHIAVIVAIITLTLLRQLL
jgi:hypothetical protein